MKQPTYIQTILGENFRKAREEQGVSLADLAGMAILSEDQIKQIENGGNKSFYTDTIKLQSAKKVAKILGLTDQEAFESKEVKHSQQLPLPLPEIEKPKPVVVHKANLEKTVQTNSSPKVESKQASKVKKKLSIELGKISSISTHLEGVIASAETGDDRRRKKAISYFKVFAYLGTAVALVFIVAYYYHQSKAAKINPSIVVTPAIENQEPNKAEARKEIEPAKIIKAPTLETLTPKETPKVIN